MANIWGIQQLVPHSATVPSQVERVGVQLLSMDHRSMHVEWSVTDATDLVRPAPVTPARIDNLWQTTCFEVFLKSLTSDNYVELNFSPSFAWAAYSFDGYRAGMQPLPVRLDPEIWISEQEGPWFWLSAEFDIDLQGAVLASFAAIIEESGGTKSYWALAHPPSGPPDFHDPTSFVLELPPP